MSLHELDARGLSCPLPVIRMRNKMNELALGETLRVKVTDRGAPADFRAWAQQTENVVVDVIDEGDHQTIVLRKLADSPGSAEPHPHVLDAGVLAERHAQGTAPAIVDVREPAEFAAGHIPGAVNIPLGDILAGHAALPDGELAIICRTGRRSDVACRLIAEGGRKDVYNVIPGMKDWTGPRQTGSSKAKETDLER